ncbi:MAG: molybdopterin-binding protein [Armatimonadetes bacterium]|nr:molybdopterin-binding protein [Armatimonadota bacterium]MCX7968385.1 molybdopterin-binding protein [Armatimonadota bacterium]MDW8143496.1 molybdopterin-binding protein [Armatimonadota bacterium]
MSEKRSHEIHRTHAETLEFVKCAVLTISDTRVEETDTSGQLIRSLLNANGHPVLRYQIVRDDVWQIRKVIVSWLTDDEVDTIITTGSTGLSPRDVAVEAIEPLLDKKLEGFGEIFRSLSYGEIGSAAMMSRAFAGVANGKVVFCLPGSPNACQFALQKLILPELRHLVWTVRGQK